MKQVCSLVFEPEKREFARPGDNNSVYILGWDDGLATLSATHSRMNLRDLGFLIKSLEQAHSLMTTQQEHKPKPLPSTLF